MLDDAVMPQIEIAKRYNQGKPRLSMLMSAPDALIGITRVLEFGAQKYARDNWLKGFPYSELVDSTSRHLLQFMTGEDNDIESGLSHVYHAGCNMLFLGQHIVSNRHLDDRTTFFNDLLKVKT